MGRYSFMRCWCIAAGYRLLIIVPFSLFTERRDSRHLLRRSVFFRVFRQRDPPPTPPRFIISTFGAWYQCLSWETDVLCHLWFVILNSSARRRRWFVSCDFCTSDSQISRQHSKWIFVLNAAWETHAFVDCCREKESGRTLLSDSRNRFVARLPACPGSFHISNPLYPNPTPWAFNSSGTKKAGYLSSFSNFPPTRRWRRERLKISFRLQMRVHWAYS